MKRTYYTNGIKEVRLLPDEPVLEGWHKGRLRPVFKSSGYRWINNGERELTIPSFEPVPDGYSVGRLPKSRESADKQRQTLKSKHYKVYNNGVKELRVSAHDVVPEGYVLGRLPMSVAQRNKISVAHKGLTHTEQTKKLISEHSNNNRNKAKETCMKKYGVPYAMMVEEYQNKANATKRKHNTFNSSTPEQKFYNELVEKYGKNNVLRHYKSKEYPFYCDFYVIPTQEYIELNLHWTHGGRPYIKGEAQCEQQLTCWKEKAITSQFYANAIYTWTVRDVLKLKTAQDNGIKLSVLYEI